MIPRLRQPALLFLSPPSAPGAAQIVHISSTCCLCWGVKAVVSATIITEEERCSLTWRNGRDVGSIRSSATVTPSTLGKPLTPRREERVGRREPTIVPSVQMKNITGAVSAKAAPRGGQVLGRRQDTVGAPFCPPRSAPSTRWRTALLLCKAFVRLVTKVHFSISQSRKMPFLLADGIFRGR